MKKRRIQEKKEEEEKEVEDKFDLEEIRISIKDDLDERFPEAKFGVTVHRRKLRNHEIIIVVPKEEYIFEVMKIAREYVRAEWHDYLQCSKLNFLPIVKLRGTESEQTNDCE